MVFLAENHFPKTKPLQPRHNAQPLPTQPNYQNLFPSQPWPAFGASNQMLVRVQGFGQTNKSHISVVELPISKPQGRMSIWFSFPEGPISNHAQRGRPNRKATPPGPAKTVSEAQTARGQRRGEPPIRTPANHKPGRLKTIPNQFVLFQDFQTFKQAQVNT